MNSTNNSIEVDKTTPRDFRFSFMSDLFIWGVGLGFGALFSHRYFLCAILFVVYEALHLIYIFFLLPSRIPYRFEFVDGVVRLYCQALKKTIVKEIPYDEFVFVKMDWHHKKRPFIEIKYYDARRPNYYSFCMAPLNEAGHWDSFAIDTLLTLAHQNGVSIQNWDSPFL